jgi:hypothetical protein
MTPEQYHLLEQDNQLECLLLQHLLMATILNFQLTQTFVEDLLVSHDYCAPSNALFLRQGACIQ